MKTILATVDIKMMKKKMNVCGTLTKIALCFINLLFLGFALMLFRFGVGVAAREQEAMQYFVEYPLLELYTSPIYLCPCAMFLAIITWLGFIGSLLESKNCLVLYSIILKLCVITETIIIMLMVVGMINCPSVFTVRDDTIFSNQTINNCDNSTKSINVYVLVTDTIFCISLAVWFGFFILIPALILYIKAAAILCATYMIKCINSKNIPPIEKSATPISCKVNGSYDYENLLQYL